MELLAVEYGWMVLSSLSGDDLLLVASAVWSALHKVHAAQAPWWWLTSASRLPSMQCNGQVHEALMALIATLLLKHGWPGSHFTCVLHAHNPCNGLKTSTAMLSVPAKLS